MPKNQYLADLRVGDYVDTIVVVKSKRRIPYRNRPGYYLALLLKDKTGAVEARVWEDAERIDREIAERDVVRVRGIVELYQQLPQVRVASVEKLEEGGYDWAELIPRTEQDVEVLWKRVTDAVESVRNQYLSSLLRSFFNDQGFVEAFKNAPASLHLHHNWVGGLIEHICTVLDLAETICQHYPELDRDLLITGVLLHDVGKVREYSWQADIDRTDEGRLLGHLVLGDEMVAEKIKQIPNFPPELAMRVRHMLISHHGVGEWGSPRPPMTLEAAALHFIEFTDAQLRKFATVLKERREPESAWTTYERTLGRRLFAGYPTPPSVEPIPAEEVVSEGVSPVTETFPSLEELSPISPDLELLPSELEALVTELPELPSELPELTEIPEIPNLSEIEEEQPRKRRQKRSEPPEEGRLPL
ncbi:MAG: HD domain-containing protein [Armatimonadetes bacterium]|nr:HD domain-containing protein [Armatimonadota bacterium]MCX7969401.1 HD domain-containing protein [Armatimonadota bacterium]MDW8144176.1 HD domain-containing protein [Armatimonadota bacterium]